MFGYAAFLLWSALSSEPDDYSCVFKRRGSQEGVVKVLLLTTIENGKYKRAFCVGDLH